MCAKNKSMAAKTTRSRRIQTPSGEEVGNYRDLNRGPHIPRNRATGPIKQANKLWTIDIVEEEENKAKIHYIGWSHKHDEWRLKEDITRTLSQSSAVISQLKIQIKEQLYGASRRDIYRVIRIPAGEEDFSKIAPAGTIFKQTKTKTIYFINQRQCLERVLGTAWDYRVINKQGDNFFAKTNTVRFYLGFRKPLQEYLLFPDHVEPITQDRGTNLVFSFVVCNGNRSMFTCLLNNDIL
ncbi:uncharacterized protein [Argopecten irradians]|uniref:uncharacterized protein n=1 Tax=Argopecten irradians TaxID=31199 RepID=UPI00371B4ABC